LGDFGWLRRVEWLIQNPATKTIFNPKEISRSILLFAFIGQWTNGDVQLLQQNSARATVASRRVLARGFVRQCRFEFLKSLNEMTGLSEIRFPLQYKSEKILCFESLSSAFGCRFPLRFPNGGCGKNHSPQK
jgi:hypothetical protein